ncbi:Serine/threonine-protein phosphatase 7 long form [Glycine soja]
MRIEALNINDIFLVMFIKYTSLVQLMVTFYGCKLSMFHNIFGMGKKTENYTSDELSPCIKVKKKYQRKLFLYFDNLMGYLKINVTLISVLIERWRSETHTFHMRCGECMITLQDVSVLLGLHVDGSSLIGPTNLDWADLCEKLLGVRPQEGELQGSVLAHHFSQLNNHDGNVQHLKRFTRAWILRFIGGVLFVDKSSNKVSLRYLQFLCDFRECSTYPWGPVVLAYLYREMCSATDYKTKSIGGMWLRRGNQHIDNDDLIVFRRKLDIMKRHEKRTSVVHSGATHVFPSYWHQPDRGVLRNPPLNLHGIMLKGKQDENWGQLFAPMISQWNNRVDFRVDDYPRQEGLLSFNSNYMVCYRRKTKMFVDPKNANTTTLYVVSPQGRNTWTVDDLVPYVEKITILSEEQERIIESVSHGPATEHQFPAQ